MNFGNERNLVILGGGNMGQAIARGLVHAGGLQPSQIIVTRRRIELAQDLSAEGFQVMSDNRLAVSQAYVIIIAVDPQHMDGLLKEIGESVQPDQCVISIVTGVPTGEIRAQLPARPQIVRAMPNTAVRIRQSMTCLASDSASSETMRLAQDLFGLLGETVVISEELMVPATALCACGVAFFLRSIRAASQGGIEIGFHAEESLRIAAQTAKGAAAILLETSAHPEQEIDKVTTPRGCTIAGLNEMEHSGFSSAMIRGLKVSAEKAAQLYQKKTTNG